MNMLFFLTHDTARFLDVLLWPGNSRITPHVNIFSTSMPSRRLRGLAPEIDTKTSPSRHSRAERRARRSRAIARTEDAQLQAVAADDAPKGNAASQEDHSSSQVAVLAQVAVHSPRHSNAASSSQAAAKMPETNAGSHSEHTGGLDSPHNSSPASPLGILAGVSGLCHQLHVLMVETTRATRPDDQRED